MDPNLAETLLDGVGDKLLASVGQPSRTITRERRNSTAIVLLTVVPLAGVLTPAPAGFVPDQADDGIVAARRGRRPEGCARAVDDLLRERGPLSLAEMVELLNPNGEARHGKTTIEESLSGLVAAKLVIKTARGVYQAVGVG